jgi:hypothetical protein
VYLVSGEVTGPPVVPAASVDDVAVAQAGTPTNARFLVTLDQSTTTTVTVDFATVDGSAKAGTDYTARSGTLTFGPGQTVKSVDVPVPADSGPKPDRDFKLVLSNPTKVTLAKATGTGTIIGRPADAAPPAAPTPPAPPVTPEQQKQSDLPVSITKRVKTLAPNVVAVELSCPRATVICAGTLQLLMPGKNKKAGEKRIARATFFLRPAESRFISMRLFSQVATIFQRLGKITPTIDAQMRDGSGTKVKLTFTTKEKN